jgi:hypothetical protein
LIDKEADWYAHPDNYAAQKHPKVIAWLQTLDVIYWLHPPLLLDNFQRVTKQLRSIAVCASWWVFWAGDLGGYWIAQRRRR